jgi:glycosyltransferase involved in cell wall biosynthesis
MNIGIVTTWFERGAAYVSRQFYDVLVASGNNVLIYARGGEEYAIGDPNWDMPNVTWGKKIISPFATTIVDEKEFCRWAINNKLDLVLFNEQHWFRPVVWCHELSIKTVAYVDYYTEATLPLYNLYDAVICNTKRHMEAMDNHPMALYVPWGTDVQLFRPKDDTGNLVNKSYVTFFHSAGYNGVRKGTDLLIKAFSQCKKAQKLIIHTQSDLKILYPHMCQTIDDLISHNRLEIINKTVSAPGLYSLGDIYVYPTRLEGIGLTIPESLACGLGCLITDAPPMNEFFNSSCGLPIEVERYYSRYDGYYWPLSKIKVADLTSKMDYLASNIEKVKQMKKDARIFALKNLDRNRNFSKLSKILENVKLRSLESSLLRDLDLYENRGFGALNKYIIKCNSLYRLLYRVRHSHV